MACPLEQQKIVLTNTIVSCGISCALLDLSFADLVFPSVIFYGGAIGEDASLGSAYPHIHPFLKVSFKRDATNQ